jgi:hypothetical protein
MGLRNVEDQARRATSRVDGNLQVLDFVVEYGRVEGNAVLVIFNAGFVVPQRFILVGA